MFPSMQMADVVENESRMAYMKPSSASSSAEEPRGSSKGFVVREAPWATSSEKVKLLWTLSYWHGFSGFKFKIFKYELEAFKS